MPAGADAGLRFGEVGVVAVYVEYHVAGGIAYLGLWVRGSVVEKPEGVCVRFSGPFDCCEAMEPRVVSMAGSTAIE